MLQHFLQKIVCTKNQSRTVINEKSIDRSSYYDTISISLVHVSICESHSVCDFRQVLFSITMVVYYFGVCVLHSLIPKRLSIVMCIFVFVFCIHYAFSLRIAEHFQTVCIRALIFVLSLFSSNELSILAFATESLGIPFAGTGSSSSIHFTSDRRASLQTKSSSDCPN